MLDVLVCCRFSGPTHRSGLLLPFCGDTIAAAYAGWSGFFLLHESFSFYCRRLARAEFSGQR